MASRLANRRSYDRRNQPRLGKPRGPAKGKIAQLPLLNAEIAARLEAARQEQALLAAGQDLPHTCEFCARYAYRLCTNIRECELEAVGEPCHWEPAYKTDDGWLDDEL